MNKDKIRPPKQYKKFNPKSMQVFFSKIESLN